MVNGSDCRTTAPSTGLSRVTVGTSPSPVPVFPSPPATRSSTVATADSPAASVAVRVTTCSPPERRLVLNIR